MPVPVSRGIYPNKNYITACLKWLAVSLKLLAGIHQVPCKDGPHIEKEDGRKSNDENNCHAACSPEETLTLEFVADGNSGQCEACVGEDEGPPAEMKLLWW